MQRIHNVLMATTNQNIRIAGPTYATILRIHRCLYLKTEFNIALKDIVNKVCNQADMLSLCADLEPTFMATEGSHVIGISPDAIAKIDNVLGQLSNDHKGLCRKNVIDKVFSCADHGQIFGISEIMDVIGTEPDTSKSTNI